MSTKDDAKGGGDAAMHEGTAKLLAQILDHLKVGLQPRPLSQDAENAVAAYSKNRSTLHH